jgi:hypothetical protein
MDAEFLRRARAIAGGARERGLDSLKSKGLQAATARFDVSPVDRSRLKNGWRL